jgi:hypothetical protein
MINLSMTQAIELWDELRDCLEGCNRYGGDTAEIYAYRLTKHHVPTKGTGPSYPDEDEFQIAASLTNLVQHFCYRHECKAEITCSGSTIQGIVRIFPQLGKGGSVPPFPFSHRAHVKIIREDEN